MKTHRLTLATAALLLISLQAANAACYADYKAKRDNPLTLLYGVSKLPDSACSSKKAAAKEISKKIARDGWKLLTVIGIFDESGLDERKDSAGAYYLKY